MGRVGKERGGKEMDGCPLTAMLPKLISVNTFGGPAWSAMFTCILCHICQLHHINKVLIPSVVATPAPIFAKAYIDTMHMPLSRAYKYIVQARCSLSFYPKFHMLRAETARTLGDWIYKDILCQWGSLRMIVTDNGPAFLKAMEYLSKRYHLNHIWISRYNS
jgi:hypothetical protein